MCMPGSQRSGHHKKEAKYQNICYGIACVGSGHLTMAFVIIVRSRVVNLPILGTNTNTNTSTKYTCDTGQTRNNTDIRVDHPSEFLSATTHVITNTDMHSAFVRKCISSVGLSIKRTSFECGSPRRCAAVHGRLQLRGGEMEKWKWRFARDTVAPRGPPNCMRPGACFLRDARSLSSVSFLRALSEPRRDTSRPEEHSAFGEPRRKRCRD